MNYFPIQTSFSAGELSPHLFGRVDLVEYHEGAEKCINFYPDVHGPVVKRGGFEYLNTRTAATFAQIFTRQVTQQSAWVFTFTHLSLQIDAYTSAGLVHTQNMITTYTLAELPDLRWVEVPESLSSYILHRDHIPAKIVFDSDPDWTLSTPSWSEPPAGWTTAYPSVGIFHQGRLWLSGSPEHPEHLWGSTLSDYEDFGTTTPTDRAAIEKVLTAAGAILWIQSQITLLVGTVFAEYSVFATDTTLTVADIHSLQQSQYGSAFIQPILLGDKVSYVSADGAKVRIMGYRFEQDTFLSQDLTYYSEHITAPGLVDIAWAQNPDYLLWGLTSDSRLVTLTYERDKDIGGWAQHTIYEEVYSIATVLINGKSFLVIAMKNGADVDICVYTPTVFLDNHTVSTTGMPKNTMTGLSRFEGLTVDVLVDGAVHPSVQVISGAITLDYDAQTEIIAGFGYTAQLLTLPYDRVEAGNSRMSEMKHYARLFVRLSNSAMPTINGDRPPDRSPSTPMNTPEPLLSGDVKVSNVGRDRFARIDIQQELPLPCIVTAVFGKLAGHSV